MRLATIETWAGPRAALQVGEGFVDIHATEPNLPGNLRQILEAGPDILKAIAPLAHRPKAVKILADRVQFHAPIVDPRKIICVGLNYKDHAAESGAPIPKEPVLFSKYATALIGHGEDIVLPPVSQEVDYEAELVVVLGQRGRDISPDKGMDYVAGYTIGHDVSARDWQLKKDGKQWMAGKTFDTFAPTGPELVTADEAPDPHALPIRLRLNGQTMQARNPRERIFPVGFVVAHLSQFLTLPPSDV